VTSKGSLSSQFRRALDAGNAMTAYELAREVRHVTLEDALRLCLILAQAQDWRYERAAKRWLQRFSAEAHPSLTEVLMAGTALAELGRTPGSKVARHTLGQLVQRA
jgi:hypothetical protein